MQPRRLIVISGPEEPGRHLANQLIRHFPADTVLDRVLTIQQVLGTENSAVIYNAWQGFDPDYLAAIGGTIVAGGVLILLTPALHQWPDFADPFNQRIANWPYQIEDISGFFIQRFIAQLHNAQRSSPDSVTLIRVANSLEKPLCPLPAPVPIQHQPDYKTADQRGALANINNLMQQSDPVTIVLEADRGRGKSALLGMVVAQLLNTRPDLGIAITAPRRKTADVIYEHAGQSAPGIPFYAPDELCQTLPKLDVLIVDEAAAIPASLLGKLLPHYPQIIFSTTVQGYEGTGRGFALRFTRLLEHYAPGWQRIQLTQPIRYAEKDPLERFLFDSLLLNARPAEIRQASALHLADCQFKVLTARQLLQDDALLRQVFGLLVLAHYQTRPIDLRHMLDGKEMTIAVIKWQEKIVATALCVREGGFDKPLAHEIHYGLRRPQGHLVPQSLAVHAGISAAPLMTTLRVMRIVVHPAVQRQGIASMLLANIYQIATKESVDYLSSSFAASGGLLQFWNKQGYQPVRVGFTRDASSGSHSVIVMKPLSPAGKKIYEEGRFRFQRMLACWSEEPISGLSKTAKEELLAMFDQAGCIEKILLPSSIAGDEDKLDRADLHAYAFGKRGYESCLPAILQWVRLVYKQAEIWNCLAQSEQQLLIKKCLQRVSWEEVVVGLSFSGKKQAQEQLRSIIKKTLVMSQ